MAPAPDRLQFGFAGAEQSSEILQLFRFEVGDRPITHAILDPPDHIVAINGARALIDFEAAFRRHCSEADKVFGTAINQCRDRRLGNYVNPSTNEREVVFGEVDDPRRTGDAAVEPRLDRMPVRRDDIDRLRRHQSADMVGDERVCNPRRVLLGPDRQPSRRAADKCGQGD